MPSSLDDIAKLRAIRTELAEVLRQLQINRDVPGGDFETANQHLQNAIAEVDRSIAEAEG